MMGGKHAVHVRIALFKPVLNLRLTGHAAAQKNFLPGMTALGMGQGSQIAEDPLIGVFPDGAGVHDHHVGSFGTVSKTVAAFGQHTPDSFGIGLILLTAVGFHIGHRRDAPAVPVFPYTGAQGKLIV